MDLFEHSISSFTEMLMLPSLFDMGTNPLELSVNLSSEDYQQIDLFSHEFKDILDTIASDPNCYDDYKFCIKCDLFISQYNPGSIEIQEIKKNGIFTSNTDYDNDGICYLGFVFKSDYNDNIRYMNDKIRMSELTKFDMRIPFRTLNRYVYDSYRDKIHKLGIKFPEKLYQSKISQWCLDLLIKEFDGEIVMRIYHMSPEKLLDISNTFKNKKLRCVCGKEVNYDLLRIIDKFPFDHAVSIVKSSKVTPRDIIKYNLQVYIDEIKRRKAFQLLTFS